MLMKCILSHQVPIKDGKFDVYIAGQSYDVPAGSQFFETELSKIEANAVQSEPPEIGRNLNFNPVTKKHIVTKKKHEEVLRNDSN